MPLTDLSLDKLRDYRPDRVEQPDFDEFWKQTLAEATAAGQAPLFTPHDAGLATVEVLDVTFSGFGGDPIKAWLLLPRHRTGPLPCVVEYIGYSGGRGFPHDWLIYSAAGYAHFVMDTRGQGSGGLPGHTPDRDPHATPPAVGGYMTRGVTDPATYYYRRLMTDAALAVGAARSHPAVDAAKVAVLGGSQGGGLAIAAGGLVPDVAAVLPDVPFLCHYRRAVDIASDGPYPEIRKYCASHRRSTTEVFRTLSYFDGVNLGARATAPTLFSVALMDPICPPSTVYAAYHHYASGNDTVRKQIEVYEFNGHEGGQGFQHAARMAFLREVFS